MNTLLKQYLDRLEKDCPDWFQDDPDPLWLHLLAALLFLGGIFLWCLAAWVRR